MKNPLHTKNQKGVTLLLAVMIVSSLVLIAVTVAALAIRGLRSSRASLFNQPALGAAESGAEDALWGIKRDASAIPTCGSGSSSVTFTNSVSTYCKSYGPATFNLKANTDTVIYLYDPADPNGDTDLTALNPTYNKITVTNETVSSTNPINVYVTKLDGSAIGAQPVAVGVGASQDIDLPSFTSGSDNRMQITINSQSDGIAVVTTNIGMPTVPTIDSTGCAGRATPSHDCTGSNGESFSRRLNVTVPDASSAAGAGSGTSNNPPTVSITSPANGATFSPGSNISIQATASDTDGNVTQVEFKHDGVSLNIDNSSPYSYNWNNVPAGTYILTATAKDDAGDTTQSSTVTIRVQ